MPLPTDPKQLELSKDLLNALHSAFGIHPGSRANHAHGLLLTGTFTPTATAASLSSAPHFNQPTTPLIVRFSSSTGLPQISDTDPNSAPFGMAMRFVLGEHKHTDIVTHSTSLFPVRTGAEFLEMLGALGGADAGGYLAGHPKVREFVGGEKKAPRSFANAMMWSPNAVRFVGGKEAGERGVFGRYQVLPTEGVESLTAEELKGKEGGYLYKEVGERVKAGPVRYMLAAQLAEEGDVTDDATVYWPKERKVVELGEISVEKVVEDEKENLKEQKKIIFDPVPRVQGIEPSADPLPDIRAAVYLLSGRERRSAVVE